MASNAPAWAIETYSDKYFDGVTAVWAEAFTDLKRWRAPEFSIPAKTKTQPDLFLVAVEDGAVIGTTMAGYDGHRGWLYTVAVSQTHRGRGVGAALLREAEHRLVALGCVKINLQIVGANTAVTAFYATLGYKIEDRISMAKPVGAFAAQLEARDNCQTAIELCSEPSLRAQLLSMMVAHNEHATNLPGSAKPLGFALQSGNATRGGLWGRTFCEWLFVELLIVAEDLRGQGFGSALLARAEAEARARACIGVYLDSYEFQAPGFYLKHGYEIFARLENPVPGRTRCLLRKRLSESA